MPGSLIAQPISEQEKLELEQPREVMEQEVTPVKVTNVITATTTGFNSFEWQTDSTPCIAAGGYICGRVDVVACPRHIPLGTWVQIDGKNYECLDRLHPRYDARFDIFFDKDYQAALNWGRQTKQVTILG